MGRRHGSLTSNIYKFKCIEYENDDRLVIISTKLYSSINEMERVFGVSKRTIPKYIDNEIDSLISVNNCPLLKSIGIDKFCCFLILSKSVIETNGEVAIPVIAPVTYRLSILFFNFSSKENCIVVIGRIVSRGKRTPVNTFFIVILFVCCVCAFILKVSNGYPTITCVKPDMLPDIILILEFVCLDMLVH